MRVGSRVKLVAFTLTEAIVVISALDEFLAEMEEMWKRSEKGKSDGDKKLLLVALLEGSRKIFLVLLTKINSPPEHLNALSSHVEVLLTMALKLSSDWLLQRHGIKTDGEIHLPFERSLQSFNSYNLDFKILSLFGL